MKTLGFASGAMFRNACFDPSAGVATPGVYSLAIAVLDVDQSAMCASVEQWMSSSLGLALSGVLEPSPPHKNTAAPGCRPWRKCRSLIPRSRSL